MFVLGDSEKLRTADLGNEQIDLRPTGSPYYVWMWCPCTAA